MSFGSLVRWLCEINPKMEEPANIYTITLLFGSRLDYWHSDVINFMEKDELLPQEELCVGISLRNSSAELYCHVHPRRNQHLFPTSIELHSREEKMNQTWWRQHPGVEQLLFEARDNQNKILTLIRLVHLLQKQFNKMVMPLVEHLILINKGISTATRVFLKTLMGISFSGSCSISSHLDIEIDKTWTL